MGENEGTEKNSQWTGGVFDCRYDKYFTLLRAEDSFFEIIGCTREEFSERFHNRVMEAIYGEDREGILRGIKTQLARGTVFRYENRLITKSGKLAWVWVSAELIRESEDEEGWFHCIFHDISREKSAQQKLELSEKRYEIILNGTQDIIFELDCATSEIYYSPNFEKKFGYKIPQAGFPDSMFKTDIIFEEDKTPLREKFQSILRGGDQMEHEYRLKKSDGTYLWVSVHASGLRDENGRLLKILGIISDINDRKQEILAAQKAAVSDPLTGLYNRRECVTRMEQYMSETRDRAALILIDVDNFKLINDTYGHLKGDQVLNEIAASLRTIFRRSDIVARIGGDEFVAFMPHVHGREVLNAKVAGIQKVFSSYADIGALGTVGCSVGISFYPEHGTDFMLLFERADKAMYAAKRSGKGKFCIYGEEQSGEEQPETDENSRA